MRSKEDILKECGTEVEFGNSSVEPKVKRAMDEYAAQEVESNAKAIISFILETIGRTDLSSSITLGDLHKAIIQYGKSKNNESKA